MSRSPLFLKVKNAVKFLLFREDNPKHGTVDFGGGVVMFCSLTVVVSVIAGAIALGFMFGGPVGAVVTYLIVGALAFEVPHIIWDR